MLTNRDIKNLPSKISSEQLTKIVEDNKKDIERLMAQADDLSISCAHFNKMKTKHSLELDFRVFSIFAFMFAAVIIITDHKNDSNAGKILLLLSGGLALLYALKSKFMETKNIADEKIIPKPAVKNSYLLFKSEELSKSATAFKEAAKNLNIKYQGKI